MEKAREATDLANIRSAYAECSSSVLTGEKSSDNVTLATDGKSASEEVILTQKTDGWTGTNSDAKIGNVEVKSLKKTTGTATITVDDAGKTSIEVKLVLLVSYLKSFYIHQDNKIKTQLMLVESFSS